MSGLPKKINVIFEKNPQLAKLIPRPVLVSQSSFTSTLTQNLHGGSYNQDEFYKIVFKKDSSRKLMTIQDGPLKGLLTSTCVEKGKISDVAGLQRVDMPEVRDLMSTLLGISMYSSLQNHLSYISFLCEEIRHHQILDEQARFERISETIAESFRSIPDLALDKALRDVYLSRIVKNNDDCFEMYIAQRERFKALIRSQIELMSTGYDHYYHDGHLTVWPGRFFKNEVLQHPVFAVFERLAAGRICEVMISGNYSDSNISRHRDFILKCQSQIQNLIHQRRTAIAGVADLAQYL